MPDMSVHRHGDRWAVPEAGAESPHEEFETREAAESAARHLADGGAVDVVEDDPTGLDREDDGSPVQSDPEPPERAEPDEHTRSAQPGL